jgi:hypothetical protein
MLRLLQCTSAMPLPGVQSVEIGLWLVAVIRCAVTLGGWWLLGALLSVKACTPLNSFQYPIVCSSHPPFCCGKNTGPLNFNREIKVEDMPMPSFGGKVKGFYRECSSLPIMVTVGESR